MSGHRSFPVVLDDGQTATMFATSRFLDERDDRLIRTKDGREFLVPKSALEPRTDGTYKLLLPMEELDRFSRAGNAQANDARQVSRPNPEHLRDGGVIPVIEEQIEVSKREHETGRLRIHKSVETRDVDVEESLLRRQYEVERVPVDRLIEAPMEPWYEGDTLVLPVFEEVLVVEKRLVLREEIRVTRRTDERLERQSVPVRREHVDVERVR